MFLSGNHKAIAEWKLEHALERTKTNRPDLYAKWVEAHPEHFLKKKKRVKQTGYKPRKPQYSPADFPFEVNQEGGSASPAEPQA